MSTAGEGPSDTAEPSGTAEPSDIAEPSGTTEDGELLYECSDWSGESRRLLASLLVSSGVVHAWQGTTVTVRPQDEDVVDSLIDEVQASARPPLPEDAPRIVYEVGGWPVVLQTELTDALTGADLPYEWDEDGDLVVLAEHEDRVEELLAELPDPDEAELDAEDGLAVHELLDRLFVAADKLARRPGDAGATLAVDETVPRVAALAPPFGFEPAQWRALVAPAVRLRDLLTGEAGPRESADDQGGGAQDEAAGEAADDDQVADAARELRDLLRTWI